ncbi:hypothetical protein FACS1894126_0660 [Alphaproteobacteria bacterium]|nr:hypothetical protein FACS1894126_0660 [Alphaproteobacteria bacterium]
MTVLAARAFTDSFSSLQVHLAYLSASSEAENESSVTLAVDRGMIVVYDKGIIDGIEMTGAIEILEKREDIVSTLSSVVSDVFARWSFTFFFHIVFFGHRAN